MRPTSVRSALSVLLLGLAACSEPAPPGADPQLALLRHFQDPFGRQPVELELHAGARASIAYVDSGLLSQPRAEQRRQAHAVAHYLWRAYAEAAGVDTVAVAFTERQSKSPLRSSHTTQTFFFYSEQLRGAPAVTAAP